MESCPSPIPQSNNMEIEADNYQRIWLFALAACTKRDSKHILTALGK